MKPRVMLFDEPTSALDPELVGEVLQGRVHTTSSRLSIGTCFHLPVEAKQI
jgi:ABC-type polar amino acid transport system ATPase subunit